jgi:hypothetical protein
LLKPSPFTMEILLVYSFVGGQARLVGANLTLDGALKCISELQDISNHTKQLEPDGFSYYNKEKEPNLWAQDYRTDHLGALEWTIKKVKVGD